MLRMKAIMDDRMGVILGFTEADIEHLQAGLPIVFETRVQGEDLALGAELVMLFAAKDEEQLKAVLRARGTLWPGEW